MVINSVSDTFSFENYETNPQNYLIVYYYDELPNSTGNVFGNFPSTSTWNSLNKETKNLNNAGVVEASHIVRNQKGRVSAIAYRENPNQVFNYIVFSYDERGRVEAMLRLTDNIGFDGIFYTYNSADAVTSTTVIDASSQFTTWYRYDDFMRVEKVYTELSQSEGTNFKGFVHYDANTLMYVSYPSTLNTLPEIDDYVYNCQYNNMNQLTEKLNKTLNQTTTNTYSSRGWLNSTEVKDQYSSIIYSCENTYDLSNIGNIISQTFEQSTNNITNEYEYNFFSNSIQKSTIIAKNGGTEVFKQVKDYTYDLIGNRTTSWETDDIYSQVQILTYNSENIMQNPNALINVKFNSMTNGNSDISNSYYGGGALKTKVEDKQIKGTDFWKRTQHDFDYDFRGLLKKFDQRSAVIQDGNRECTEPLGDYNLVSWGYHYNPFGERESKRMNYSYKGNANGEVYPRAYYLLGGNNEQFATYYGYHTKAGAYTYSNGAGTCNYPQDAVLMYLAEFNVYAPDGQTMTYAADANGDLRKTFKILDHLGNVRMTLNEDGTITQNSIYEPFGKQIPLMDGTNSRLGFISKEKDIESSLGDFGVRKYDEEIGRFTSLDLLWEKYLGWNPYHYCGNNPVKRLDPSGLDWLLYTGKKILWYAGDKGDKSKLLHSYKATSGYKGMVNNKLTGREQFVDAQNSKYQNIKNGGPIPEGTYLINLTLSSKRVVKTNKDGEAIRDRGIQQLPKDKDGNPPQDWGSQRARLEPEKGTDLLGRENNFYIHDSSKGYTHGCIEAETLLFRELLNYQKENKNIEVVIDYPDNNTNTNGGTKK